MEGWVDIDYPAMHRPGFELAIFRSLVRLPTTTLPSQPQMILCGTRLLVGWFVRSLMCSLVCSLIPTTGCNGRCTAGGSVTGGQRCARLTEMAPYERLFSCNCNSDERDLVSCDLCLSSSSFITPEATDNTQEHIKSYTISKMIH